MHCFSKSSPRAVSAPRSSATKIAPRPPDTGRYSAGREAADCGISGRFSFEGPGSSIFAQRGETALSTTQLAHQSSQATIAQFERYVIANYRRYPVSLVRGEA